MIRARLVIFVVLVAGVLTACDGMLFTLDDVSEKLTITNASTTQSAVVWVDFGDASSQLRMPPGSARTATVVGATGYRVAVLAADLPADQTYREQLLELRQTLVDLVDGPYTAGMDLVTYLGEVAKVEAALAQLHGSSNSQSCSHPAKPDGHDRVTITYATPGGIEPGVWQLDCN